MLTALVTTVTIILMGFISGAILRHMFPNQVQRLNFWCTRLALQGAIPLSLLAAIWQLHHLSWQLFLLTIVGSLILLSGGGLAAFLAKWLKLSPSQTGAYIPAGMFMNIGAIGCFCVYLFLGEDGLALVPLYKLFEEVIYYSIAFPIARRLGQYSQQKQRPFWLDPFLLTTLSAVSAGFILNGSGLARPLWISDVMQFIVPLGTYLLMITVGLVFRFTDITGLLRPALTLAISRSILGPILVIILAYLFQLWGIHQGLLVKVALLLSVMPTAFLSLLPPVIYGVDQKIANSYWLISSLWFLFIFPIVLLLMHFLFL
ncbi:hypothetical protein [Celerinatantimonas sp. YJH-8]|uniref:hypothetical protein n=1 Tax=Celerinatantimonas sp. YJH-8 TaxID=3228714 RepID=UPI0038CA4A7A